jgi:hypothetical protein
MAFPPGKCSYQKAAPASTGTEKHAISHQEPCNKPEMPCLHKAAAERLHPFAKSCKVIGKAASGQRLLMANPFT